MSFVSLSSEIYYELSENCESAKMSLKLRKTVFLSRNGCTISFEKS